jgi:serine/threonine protein kinase
MSHDPFKLVGSTVCGHYAIESVVAEGGFSIVYRARHTLWNRPVAIKAFHGVDGLDVEARDEMIRAFVQEGAMLAELSERTTAIVQARDMATVVTPAGDWVPFLILEWLEGECLETVLWHERQALLPTRSLAEAFALLDPVAKALALAHAKGICHRDLKPGNIFVLGDPRGSGGSTKLLDFGVASFFSDSARTQRRGERRPTGSYAFTPAYAAPEQFCDAYGVTGPWTDVFALALIMTELLVGHGPVGPSPAALASGAVAHSARRATPATLGAPIPASAERVFARAVAVFPAERWQTVGSFWEALGRVIPQSTTVAVSSYARRKRAAPPRSAERVRFRAGIATLGLLALAIGATAVSDAAVRPAAKNGRAAAVSASAGAPQEP